MVDARRGRPGAHIRAHRKKTIQPQHAKTVKAIYKGCEGLKNFPHLGRAGRMSGRRELVVAP